MYWNPYIIPKADPVKEQKIFPNNNMDIDKPGG